MEIFEFLVAVRSSLKKFKVKYDPEFFFSTTFEAVLYIFRKDYPDSKLIVNGNYEKTDDSDPEEDIDQPIRNELRTF